MMARMADEPTVSFALQRARPIRGPGIAEPPAMVQEPPARQLRRQPNKKQAPPPEPDAPTPPDPDMIPQRVANGDGTATGGAEPAMITSVRNNSIGPAEVAIPIGDVLALTKFPKTLEALQLFHEMTHAEGRLALQMVHKLWPELFG